jgi:two-component system sensor histidine kinase KdpD
MKKRNLRFPKNIRYTLIMVSFLILATATGYLFRWIGFPEANIVLAYLLAVLLTARYSEGYIYGMMAAVASIFLYNYFLRNLTIPLRLITRAMS